MCAVLVEGMTVLFKRKRVNGNSIPFLSRSRGMLMGPGYFEEYISWELYFGGKFPLWSSPEIWLGKN
jgi:hypothetical protein